MRPEERLAAIRAAVAAGSDISARAAQILLDMLDGVSVPTETGAPDPDSPHVPQPSDICSVCGNGLVHIDSHRDPQPVPAEPGPRPSVTWKGADRTAIVLMAPVVDGLCSGCGTKPTRETGSCRCLFRVDDVIRGVPTEPGAPDPKPRDILDYHPDAVYARQWASGEKVGTGSVVPFSQPVPAPEPSARLREALAAWERNGAPNRKSLAAFGIRPTLAAAPEDPEP